MSTPVQKPPAPPESSGPPLRALAMVLISLAIVFAALGLFSLTGSDSDEAAPVTADVTTTAPAAPSAPAAPAVTPGSTAAAAPTTSAGDSTTTTSGSAASSSIRVLNNSNTAGLAASTAETLEQAGFTIAETGNYSDGTIPETTVFFDSSVSGQQAQAEEIAAEIGAQAQPRFAGIEDAAPGIVVIVTE